MSLRVAAAGSRTRHRLAAGSLLALLVAVETLLPFPAFHTDGPAALMPAAAAPAAGAASQAGPSHDLPPSSHDCLACALLGLSLVLTPASIMNVRPAAVALVAAPALPHRSAPAIGGLRSRAPPAV